MLEFLPENLYQKVKPYIGKGLAELRLRVNKPTYILLNGKFVVLRGVFITAEDVNKIILRLTKRSVYCYEDNIRRGYLTGEHGERIGIAGECVVDGGVRYIKNVTSLCVRIPNAAFGCASRFAMKYFAGGVKNVLVISPPGGGKTTFLRDLARVLSDEYDKNVLIVDEKCELSGEDFDVGARTDVLRYADKAFGLRYGVLNMRPDVIVLDELSKSEEINQLCVTAFSGVNVMASVHGANIEDVKNNVLLKELFLLKIFNYAVVLSLSKGSGTVESVEAL